MVVTAHYPHGQTLISFIVSSLITFDAKRVHHSMVQHGRFQGARALRGPWEIRCSGVDTPVARSKMSRSLQKSIQRLSVSGNWRENSKKNEAPGYGCMDDFWHVNFWRCFGVPAVDLHTLHTAHLILQVSGHQSGLIVKSQHVSSVAVLGMLYPQPSYTSKTLGYPLVMTDIVIENGDL